MDTTKESSLLIKKLAQNIEKWKKSNDISQRELGKRSNIGESTLRSIKGGSQNIEIATLVKLKLAFSVNVSDLLRGNEKYPKILPHPISLVTVRKTVTSEQVKIGKSISKVMKEKNINPEDLSIMASNTDYSDTVKYLKGQINLTLITILKFANALEVEIEELLE